MVYNKIKLKTKENKQMSYIKTLSTKELVEHKTLQIERILNHKNRLAEKNYTTYYPNERTVKEALAFEQNELKIIEKELTERNEVAVLTIKVEIENSVFGVGFYENISTWQKEILNSVEEDFGFSSDRIMDIETFKDILSKHGYTFYDREVYQNITNIELINELTETFKN
jgi:hypothetical protein